MLERTGSHPILRTEPKSGFSRLMRLTSEFVVKRPTLVGLEHLAELQGKPVIFAVTHLSDIDVQTAAAELSAYMPLDVATLATNMEDPIQRRAMKIAGLSHFHPIQNTFDARTQTPHATFRAEDFAQMQQAIEAGRSIVIAAHNPTRKGEFPKHAGIGAVYLAQLTGVPVIPVSLDIQSKTPVGLADDLFGVTRRLISGRRPQATLTIGEPIQLGPLNPERLDHTTEDIQDVAMVLSGQQRELGIVSGERYMRALKNTSALYKQAVKVMQVLASQLSPEKRGRWGISTQVS